MSRQNTTLAGSDDSGIEDSDDDKKRRDQYFLITQERDIRHSDQLRITCAKYTGLICSTRQLLPMFANNVCTAIELDAEEFVNEQKRLAKFKKREEANGSKTSDKNTPMQMGGLPSGIPTINHKVESGIVNLCLEDTLVTSGAVLRLKDFLARKPLIECLQLVNVEFQDNPGDFKRIIEGVQFSNKVRKLVLQNLFFDSEVHGKALNKMLLESKVLRELDISSCDFFYPKCFYEMCSALVQDKCRLNTLRLRGMNLTNLEAKVLQLVLMKNRQIHTLDLSFCKIEQPENLTFFIQKFDQFCNVRYLTLDGLMPDVSPSMEAFGLALSNNKKLEVLMMRDLSIRANAYQSFWLKMLKNQNLKKISVQKTDLTDKVVESLSLYLSVDYLQLVDLDISRNQITDAGLSQISEALIGNTTVKYLNLSQNNIKERGLQSLVALLNQKSCNIIELSLNGNKINQEGIVILSFFLPVNKSLFMLDIGKNDFNDHSFNSFAAQLRFNQTLKLLDISKNKEIHDEGSLVTLVQSIAHNQSIQTLDVTGLKLRKNFLKQYFEPALQSNITLKFVYGKFPPEVIDDELQENITIENEIVPKYQSKFHGYKGTFKIRYVDARKPTALILEKSSPRLFYPAFKFIKYHDIRICDFTNMRLTDENVVLITDYLKKNPNMRSLTLDKNQLTDITLFNLSTALRQNTKLAHFSFKDCRQMTDEGLQALSDVICADNTVLFCVNFDLENFSFEIGYKLLDEAQLNQAIMQMLKPQIRMTRLSDSILQTVSQFTIDTLGLSRMHLAENREMKEVIFNPGAKAGRSFQSALKCWRIHVPNIIQIEEQNLNDDHVALLCEFLQDKNMVFQLNLRRNQITNKGVKTLVDFLKNHDKSIYKLDLQRNRITTQGGLDLIQCLKECVRILDLQVYYGNKMPRYIDYEIGCELEANAQIIKNRELNHVSKKQISIFQRMKDKSHQVYELRDHGPEYIRCAVKTVELLNILQLYLPDNSLGLPEAKMLCEMLKMNTGLVTLNLQHNQFEHESAELFGKALAVNQKLESFDLSGNRLGDLGCLKLLKPLIKQRQDLNKKLLTIQQYGDIERQIEKPQTNLMQKFLRGKEESAVIKQKQKILIFQQEIARYNHFNKTQLEQPCNLLSMKVNHNECTKESFKAFWALIEANPIIMLKFDSPEQVEERIIRKLNGHSVIPFVMDARFLKDKDKKNNEDDNFKTNESVHEVDESVTLNSNRDRTKSDVKIDEQMPFGSIGGSEATQTESSLDEQEQAKQDKLAQQRERQENRVRILSLICCYKGFKQDVMRPDELPSVKLVCCWRLYKSRQRAYQYQAWPDPKLACEDSRAQNLLTIAIFIQIIAFYLALGLTFAMEESADIVMLGVAYHVQALIFEFFMYYQFRKVANNESFNVFAIIQAMVGTLYKLHIFSIVVKAEYIYQTDDLDKYASAHYAFFVVAMNLLFQACLIFQAFMIKKDSMIVRPLAKRNMYLAQASYMLKLSLVLRQISIEPTSTSLEQAHQIAVELNPDLKVDVTTYFGKFKKFLRKLYHSMALYHFISVDLPSIGLVYYVMQHNLDPDHITQSWFIVVTWLLDSICSIIIFMEDDQGLSQSVNAEHVFMLSQERLAKPGDADVPEEEDSQFIDENEKTKDVEVSKADIKVDISDIKSDTLSIQGQAVEENNNQRDSTNVGNKTLSPKRVNFSDQSFGDEGIEFAPRQMNQPKLNSKSRNSEVFTSEQQKGQQNDQKSGVDEIVSERQPILKTADENSRNAQILAGLKTMEP